MNTERSLPFWRGEGCLNTFIIFDLTAVPDIYNEQFLAQAHAQLIKEQVDDALILLPTYDPTMFVMKILEPDGSRASFCGNGARVIAAYLEKKLGLPKRLQSSL